MNAQDFYSIRVNKAKDFALPEPIFINTERLTGRTRVLYLVEIQALHIPGKDKKTTHHYSLAFSKFIKMRPDDDEQPRWVEEDLATEKGFSIRDKESLKKLASYIKANEALLGIDVLSTDFKSAVLSNEKETIDILKSIFSSPSNNEIVEEFFKDVEIPLKNIET